MYKYVTAATAAMNEAGVTMRIVSRHTRRLRCFTGGRIGLPLIRRWMTSSGTIIVNATKLLPTTKGGIKTSANVEKQRYFLLAAKKKYNAKSSFRSKGEGVKDVTPLEDAKPPAAAPGWFATRFIKENDPYKRELEWTFHAWHWGLLGLHLLVVWWLIHKNYESHLKDFYNPLGSDGSKSLSMARLKYLEQQRRRLKAFTSVEDDPEASPKEMHRRKMEAFKLVEKEENDRMGKQHTDEVITMTGTEAVTPEEKLAATMKWREDVAAKLKETIAVRKTVPVAATTTSKDNRITAVEMEGKETKYTAVMGEDMRNKKKTEVVLTDNNSRHPAEAVVEQKNAEGKEIVKTEKKQESPVTTIEVNDAGEAGPVPDLISLQKKIESLEAKLDSAVARQEAAGR